ncbi:NACHT domain-containing protein [Sphingobacterium sp. Lzh-3]|uniref:NACHT domain-containing protein n=1 Tax=Sphingobacterium sp. Lzh-3 TaxID=3382150 RepID=UPI00398D40D1
MIKKGLEFELIALEFLERIFIELGYTITRRRNQKTGTQDGYDLLIEIVTSKYKSYTVYAECKDYNSNLSYTLALEKIPHIISTHKTIDLLLFVSPFEDFKNPNEPSKLEKFYDKIAPECPVQFLTPEYHIKEFFSLYPDLFKKVYDGDIGQVIEKERQLLLNKFDKLIFSDRNLAKIIIEETDRHIYISSIQQQPFHMERSFRTAPLRDPYLWSNPENTLEIDTLISSSQNGVVILGNPGSGKTTELNFMAVSLWDERNSNEIIPYFKSLKNFNSNSTISEILPNRYEKIPFLLVVLDGLDEVYDVTDFSNKLRSFIDSKKVSPRKNNIKFIISCRTSIYNKIVKNLDGFTEAYLNPIVDGQAIRFLRDKFGIDFINEHRKFNFWKYADLLETPFYLELIGENYLKTGVIEISRSKLISQYIKNRLDHDEKDKFRNTNYSEGLHLEQARKLAFAMETMQITSIEDSKARAILGEIDTLAKNPFIEQSIDKKWSFELKSVQEYFVAQILTQMDIDQLLDLIKIDDKICKVHPAWYNVVTLLLNMEFEQVNAYEKLINWLIKNDIEMVFQADTELVSDEIRNTVLQKYFQDHCIEKTLWVSDDGTLGTFSDTLPNIEYLFDKAMSKELNLRTRQSAIILLNHMSLSNKDNATKLESLLFQIMNEFQDNEVDFLQIMERTIALIKRVDNDKKEKLIEQIKSFVSIYDYKEFVNQVINLTNENNFDRHQDFILHILKKSINEISWNKKSKYGSVISTKEKIFTLFSQIKDNEALIYLLEFILKRIGNHKLREKYVAKFIKHCSSIIRPATKSYGEKLTEIICDVITTDRIYHLEQDLLASLAKDCLVDEGLFKKLIALETENNSNIYFLETILKAEYYAHIVDVYKNGVLEDLFLIKVRNTMQYDCLEKAIQFEKFIEDNTRFIFPDRIEQSTVQDEIAFNRSSIQREFDVKFDLPLLKKQMENIFLHYNTSSLSFEEVDRFWDEYYDIIELKKNISEYAKHFLWKILREDYRADQKLKIEDLDKVLENRRLDRFEDIYQTLSENNELSIVVQDFQKKHIESWIIDIKPMIECFLDNPESRITSNELRTINSFLNFVRYLKFSGFEESFLLQLIDFSKYTLFDFDFIDEILGTEKVVLKVLEELKSISDLEIKLPFLAYLRSKEISFDKDEYGIEEDLKNSILGKNYDCARKVVELCYIDNPPILKSVANLYLEKDEDYYFLPFILNTLSDLREYDFIRNFITDNYQLLIDKKLLDEPTAVRHLVKTNGEFAFIKLKAYIIAKTKNAGDTYYDLEYQNYSNPNSIRTLLEIIKHCLSLPDLDNIFNGWFKPITKISEVFVCIGKKNGLETSKYILKGLEDIVPFDDPKNNNRFYHERLKNDITDVIYKLTSTPYTFQRAMQFNREHEYIFFN